MTCVGARGKVSAVALVGPSTGQVARGGLHSSVCQLLGMSAARPIRVHLSWSRFALRGSPEGGNPDGWGVAFAEGADVLLLREPSPAADSPLVSFLGSHGPPSDVVVSHVRRATVGARTLANTQPFVRSMGGRVHVFAHNGFVPDLPWPSSSWLRPLGDTDSELLMCELLRRLEPLYRTTDAPSLEARTEVVASLGAEMRGRGAANFLYSDGVTLFAHGHRRTLPGDAISSEPGLYLLMQDADAEAPPCEGVTGARECGRRAIVATVPLDAQRWCGLDAGELIRLERGRRV